MTEIESPYEAEWDAFHEWLDEWAKENNLNPSQAKMLIDSSGDMLEALKKVVDQKVTYVSDFQDLLRIADKAIAKAEGK